MTGDGLPEVNLKGFSFILLDVLNQIRWCLSGSGTAPAMAGRGSTGLLARTPSTSPPPAWRPRAGSSACPTPESPPGTMGISVLRCANRHRFIIRSVQVLLCGTRLRPRRIAERRTRTLCSSLHGCAASMARTRCRTA